MEKLLMEQGVLELEGSGAEEGTEEEEGVEALGATILEFTGCTE